MTQFEIFVWAIKNLKHLNFGKLVFYEDQILDSSLSINTSVISDFWHVTVYPILFRLL